jgi:hypothetical protein
VLAALGADASAPTTSATAPARAIVLRVMAVGAMVILLLGNRTWLLSRTVVSARQRAVLLR